MKRWCQRARPMKILRKTWKWSEHWIHFPIHRDPWTENRSLLTAPGVQMQPYFHLWWAFRLHRQWRKPWETNMRNKRKQEKNENNKNWTKAWVATYHGGSRFHSFINKFINKESNKASNSSNHLRKVRIQSFCNVLSTYLVFNKKLWNMQKIRNCDQYSRKKSSQ